MHSRRSILQFLSTIPLMVTLPSGLLAAARIRVRAFRHWPDPEKTRLVFDLDAESRFETNVERDPNHVVLTLHGAELRTTEPIDRTFPDDPRVLQLRAQQRADAVEIHVELTRAAELNAFHLPPNTAGRSYRIVLDIVPRLSAAEQARREASILEVRESGDVIVGIDPGHGGEDPGTVWGRSLREKEIALEVGRLLSEQLRRHPGVRPVLTRDADYFVSLGRRPALARRYGAQLFVSLHVNAARSRAARGAEVFFLSLQGAEDKAARELVDRENAADLVGGVPPDQVDEPLVDILMDMTRNHTMKDSERLAEVLLQQLHRVSGAAIRGIKQGPLAVLKSIDVPSVLVELGFFTNTDDRKLLGNARAQKQYAEEMARGIIDFLA
ncbi:MAG: N-acetylmuramoyl-L-alanine amidase [Candidatus Latescibacterota bacterium]|nr:MAG: N-acetylmuramoyl-L-alanine amidase [Candidatus Latescibacterota bacterium]